MSKKTPDNKRKRPRNVMTDVADEVRRIDGILNPVDNLLTDHHRLVERLRPALKISELANAQAHALKPFLDVAKRVSSISSVKHSTTLELANALEEIQTGAKAVQLVRNAVVHAPFRVEHRPSPSPGITAQDPPAVDALVAAYQIVSAQDIGRLVRARRKKRKLSQQKFADMAGVGRRFISELENGKGTLEVDKVLKVTAAAGIDLSARER